MPARPDSGASSTAAEAPAIGDYAIIGNCRSAALVARNGSVDWLSWPRFDSPSLFAAMLDQARGGRFAVRPAGAFTATRRYLGDTTVLETTFQCDDGVLRLTDLMPVRSEEAKRSELWPQHEILRRLECVDGAIAVDVVFQPRPDYACSTGRIVNRPRLGLFCEYGDETLVLRGDVPFTLTADRGEASSRYVVRAGERRYLSLSYAGGEPAVLPMLGEAAEERIAKSLQWWQQWIARCRYNGPYRDAVVRSALTLKLMAYAPSGAVVAAPTTSLPESLGGVRNWDYRYCWLRDASLTVQAFLDLGYGDEAEAFLSWMLHTTRVTWPDLKVLYTVYGEPNVAEHDLRHLAGFGGSQPVRVGNAAAAQFQLDVYGEVIDAVYQYVRRGGRLNRATMRMITGFGETVCKRWREPDNGCWEIRSGRRQHTFSKAMCWVALDRLRRLADEGQTTIPTAELQRVRDAIHRQIEDEGYDEIIGSYVDVLGGHELDASLLKLALHGCVDPTSPRMKSTLEAIQSRLGANGLLYRYRGQDDGLPPGEGTFGICTLWGICARLLAGDRARAVADFEHFLSYANDVGLFAEEIDPATGAALGNFPQAFTHMGIVAAAVGLAGGGFMQDTMQGTSRGQV